MTDVLPTRDVLRLIQSIPSPKAEPLKMWLAQVGSERLDEIVDPEKARLKLHTIPNKTKSVIINF